MSKDDVLIFHTKNTDLRDCLKKKKERERERERCANVVKKVNDYYLETTFLYIQKRKKKNKKIEAIHFKNLHEGNCILSFYVFYL